MIMIIICIAWPICRAGFATGDTDIVNHGNPCIPDLSYRSESCLHRPYRYILKTKQLRAKVLKNGPCKQAVRSYWMYVS